jgi:hypothetical protein
VVASPACAPPPSVRRKSASPALWITSRSRAHGPPRRPHPRSLGPVIPGSSSGNARPGHRLPASPPPKPTPWHVLGRHCYAGALNWLAPHSERRRFAFHLLTRPSPTLRTRSLTSLGARWKISTLTASTTGTSSTPRYVWKNDREHYKTPATECQSGRGDLAGAQMLQLLFRRGPARSYPLTQRRTATCIWPTDSLGGASIQPLPALLSK